jgi:hypothetical protein
LRHTCDTPACVSLAHLIVGTKKENSEDMVRRGRSCKGAYRSSSKLTDDAVRDIRRLAEKGVRHKAIAHIHGVNRATISMVVAGKTWKHVTGPYSDITPV